MLVLLYEKADGLRVLLTTRAKTLRTHPGQTALPGGKMDETDNDIVETAVRKTTRFDMLGNFTLYYISIVRLTRRSVCQGTTPQFKLYASYGHSSLGLDCW